jgi:hypothetical protein
MLRGWARSRSRSPSLQVTVNDEGESFLLVAAVPTSPHAGRSKQELHAGGLVLGRYGCGYRSAKVAPDAVGARRGRALPGEVQKRKGEVGTG